MEEMSLNVGNKSATTESNKKLGDYECRKRKEYEVEAKTRSSVKRKQMESRKYKNMLRENPAKFVAFQIAGNTKQTCSKLVSFVQ